jgi:hypothetical protein
MCGRDLQRIWAFLVFAGDAPCTCYAFCPPWRALLGSGMGRCLLCAASAGAACWGMRHWKEAAADMKRRRKLRRRSGGAPAPPGGRQRRARPCGRDASAVGGARAPRGSCEKVGKREQARRRAGAAQYQAGSQPKAHHAGLLARPLRGRAEPAGPRLQLRQRLPQALEKHTRLLSRHKCSTSSRAGCKLRTPARVASLTCRWPQPRGRRTGRQLLGLSAWHNTAAAPSKATASQPQRKGPRGHPQGGALCSEGRGGVACAQGGGPVWFAPRASK